MAVVRRLLALQDEAVVIPSPLTPQREPRNTYDRQNQHETVLYSVAPRSHGLSLYFLSSGGVVLLGS